MMGQEPDNPTRRPLPIRAAEQVFWRGAGVSWRHLAGSLSEGFSIEWHESNGTGGFDWSPSFQPCSVEICLNLAGVGWVAAEGVRTEFKQEAAGFFGSNGDPLMAKRLPGQHHQFLTVAFTLTYLRHQLGGSIGDLHPLIRRCLDSELAAAGVSGVSPINQRQRDLLRSLLHPPVLRAAQSLWYQSKALEFAAEFFFASREEPLCSRARRVAQERVAKAKTILTADLEHSPSLEELGRKVGCSPFYLSRTFTQETGVTISQWLRQVRLERAAELLRSRTCNVTEAALQVGYSSLSHFSQAFRETFGCCPGLYPVQTQSQRGLAPSPESGGKIRPGLPI